MKVFVRWALVVAVLGTGFTGRAAAQVGTTTDIITGVVLGPDSQPVAGAIVQATSIETQVSRQRTTDAKGRYTIVFPDGGGQYNMLVRAVGMAPQAFTLARQAYEDRLVGNVTMGMQAIQIAGVTVRGRANNRTTAPSPGEMDRNLNPEQVARLPIDASDLNTLATLVPGVVGIGETDSTSAQFSVAGQRPTANDVTLDGMSFGSGSVPQDAVRSTRVVTSTYDIARGQFSGGVVASTTRSGTNVPQGSFTYNLRDKDLAWGGVTNSPFSQGYTQNQIGGGFGGPVIPNKLFVFGALQGRFRGQALPSLLSADPATLARLGVNPDSVARFIQLATAAGVPINLSNIPGDRSTDNTTGLVRIDWNLSDVQTLMVRLDGRWSSQDPTRIGALSLPPTGGTRYEDGGGFMAMLTSYIGGNFINELRGYASMDRNDQSGFLALPEARVQVGSTLADSSFGFANLAFGGNPGFPQTSLTRSIEASDEFSWLPGNASHRFKLGLYANGTQQKALQTPNQLGTFIYPSLGALAANQPDLYTRTLAPLQQAGTAWNTAIYLGDTWRTGPALQVAYGARLEGAKFSGAPAFNPAVDSLFGLRTDQIPSETHFSPRVGFTWMPDAGSGFPATIVRGGFGDFRSLTPNTLYSAALAAPGLSNAETQLVCIGAAVPNPDWNTYMNDPGAVPTACTDTASAVEITPNPNVTVFAPNYSAPRAWRASLGVQRRILGGTYTVSLDGNYARGESQYGFRDLNLNTTPQFTLPQEGNRPVYVPEDSVQTATGTLSSLNSRLHAQFGQVIQVGSDLQSDSKQFTVGFGGFTARGATFQVSYTWTRALDQSSFSCCAAGQGFAAPTTAGDPNVREWATSDFERRNSFLATLTYPVSAAIEVTAIGRLSSGTPYTPLVGSDINGDGARNDRAFVFDPAAAADPAVAAAMKTLLANNSGARDCLSSQLGRIAARNSCTGPWQTSLDFQFNYRPAWFGLDRRFTMSLLTVNFLGGLDEWLHGSNNLHGWGFASSPDPVLLYVRSFNPGTSSFVYSVNGHFGSRQGSNGGVTVPFQIGFQAHFTIGPDPVRQRIRTAFGGGGGGGGGRFGGGFGGGAGGAGAPDFAARLAQVLPNPIPVILGFKDSLHFTPQQDSALQVISDSLDSLNKMVGDSLQAAVKAAGDRPDPGILFARLRPKLQLGRDNIRKALDKARLVLGPDLWGKLPTAITTPGAGRRGGPGGGGRGPGGD